MNVNADSFSREMYYMQRLEKLALFMGAAGVCCTFFSPIAAPFLLGSMSVIFAVLSKGGNLRFSRRGRIAAFLGAAAIIINVIYLVIALTTLKEMLADPVGRQQLSDLLYRQYGITLDELLPNLSIIPLLQ